MIFTTDMVVAATIKSGIWITTWLFTTGGLKHDREIDGNTKTTSIL